jgi:hypothetical protein
MTKLKVACMCLLSFKHFIGKQIEFNKWMKMKIVVKELFNGMVQFSQLLKLHLLQLFQV